MALLYTTSFIYDDICSEDYFLYIGSIGNSNGLDSSSASTNVKFISDTISSRNENFIYRNEISEDNLSFNLNLYSTKELDKEDIEIIDTWLFSNEMPKKLVFCQSDMAKYTFYANFSKNEELSVGNLIRGFKCTITCDSPYAYTMEDDIEFLNNGQIKFFDSLSSGINPIFPSIEFVCNGDNGTVNITNLDDSNRTFTMSGLLKGEKITIDKWFQINSSTGLRRLTNCNMQWLRFNKGMNRIQISGNTAKVKIGYQFFKGIGS